MRKALLLTIATFLAATTVGLAQFSAGAGLVILKPLGGFATNVGNTAGLSLNMAYRMKKIPIETGLDFNFISYAHITERVPYTEPKYQHTEADRERCSGVNIYNVFARAYAFRNKVIQPYADVRVGLSHFATTEEYTDPFRQDNSSCHSAPSLKNIKLSRDNAFNYGFGGGVQIDICKLIGKDNSSSTLLLDGGLRYIRGGFATYKNINRVPNPRDARGSYTTNTDMWLINISLKFSLGFDK